MTRWAILLVSSLYACTAAGQLTVGSTQTETALPITATLSDRLPTRGPAPLALSVLRPAAFDFGTAKPHLAFFCRLELHIEEATRFPVRFRLGEVRTWQQELTKRD